MMTEFYNINENHPNNFNLTQVPDMDVDTIWTLQEKAQAKHKGLVAQVYDRVSLGFLEDRGFNLIYTTHFAKLNVRDYAGEPVVTVGELEPDLKQELLILLRDHYERIHRTNPASKNINYQDWLFDNHHFDLKHSIVRLSQQHIVAVILIFENENDFKLGWTFGDDMAILLDLWRDLLGILPVGKVLYAEFKSNDLFAMSVYDTFMWHDIDTVAQTLLWQDTSKNLRNV
ncbi:hypothetical protein LEGA110927_01680 [Leuconostoc gasicomitatum]|uniref:hypothetical protein n=1 Tax=Leuconostoc gasicomitatum TaxID=115778 RepID=UPI0007E24792|nr:hypothetical protein [Leuconostoc gasicomitatum]MBZ5944768.1 hypothetical protein [Leuconostoc gasicomitatum]MBZ5947205.1 hypothetical protein [Leuconostoc gasicomitatum]MBZ5951360.1 hypothetical protein [Leuconostoc gasicomitatum]MBZ5961558.1 hypothetical protein [Leuconostoc gasicomitatum]MBZ5967750.1 hypothetical protein [Leuconostoc gasicomitatum]